MVCMYTYQMDRNKFQPYFLCQRNERYIKEASTLFEALWYIIAVNQPYIALILAVP
jgi:hypothetical protein